MLGNIHSVLVDEESKLLDINVQHDNHDYFTAISRSGVLLNADLRKNPYDLQRVRYDQPCDIVTSHKYSNVYAIGNNKPTLAFLNNQAEATYVVKYHVGFLEQRIGY